MLIWMKPFTNVMILISILQFDYSDSAWYLLAFTNFFVFVALLMVFRNIEFVSTQIIIIIEVFKRIFVYLFVLLLIIFSFSNSLYSLVVVDGLGINGFFENFKSSYTLAMGDFGNDETEVTGNNEWTFVIFFISSIFLMIIYSNILITIVGEGFNSVKEERILFRFRDKCEVLLDVNMASRLGW